MSSVVRSGWRFNGNGAYGSRGCAVSHSRARRWAAVLCDQFPTNSVSAVMVRFVTGLYTDLINCGCAAGGHS